MEEGESTLEIFFGLPRPRLPVAPAAAESAPLFDRDRSAPVTDDAAGDDLSAEDAAAGDNLGIDDAGEKGGDAGDRFRLRMVGRRKRN